MPKSKKSLRHNGVKLKSKLHIYCEGEKTEPAYLKAYISKFIMHHKSLIIVEKTKSNDAQKLVKQAIDAKKTAPKGDLFWVVYDREDIRDIPHNKHLKVEKLAKDNGIYCVLSNVCFELWLLLHFSFSTAPYQNYDDLIKRSALSKHLATLGINDYDKGCPDIFKLLSQNDGISRAKQNSGKLEQFIVNQAEHGKKNPCYLNPYTQMHLLLQAMNDFANAQ